MNHQGPELSLVVISYEMARELPRTLYSLSPLYQQGISAADYEVIVVDNGSGDPPREEDFASLGMNLSIHSYPDPTPSPVAAINYGLTLAKAPLVGVSIDGARLASPGLLDACRRAARVDPRAVVTTLSFQLGPGAQTYSMQHGYDAEWEDRLLEGIDWRNNGYRLFEISPFAENIQQGWFGPLGESNILFMQRELWQQLGGFDCAFRSPGGGAANVDVLQRALEAPDTRQIVVLGDALFHQIHGGTHTNAAAAGLDRFKAAAYEYYKLRGRRFRLDVTERTYFGPVSKAASDAYQRQLGLLRRGYSSAAISSAEQPQSGSTGRYLDLLKRVLLNETGLEIEVALDTLRATKEVPETFWTETLYDLSSRQAQALEEKRRTRARGGDGPSDRSGYPLGLTMIGRERLDHLEACVTAVLDEGVPGDLMECGVWRGGACMLMKAILDVRGCTDRSVWLADSFAGLPPPQQAEDEGLDISAKHFPMLAVSQQRVAQNFAAFGLLDERVRFLEGLFADTLPDCEVKQLAVLRLDGDLYSSTMQTLAALYDRVSSGGFVIIDDYGALGQCAAAVEAFRAGRGITAPINMIDWTGAFWRKP